MTTTVREQRQNERRLRVVDAAMQLARQGGYDAVQMRDMATTADVAMGTIYRYFGSKDDVLLAGLAEWAKMLQRRLLAEPIKGESAADRVVNVLRECASSTDREPKLMAALVTSMATATAGPTARLEIQQVVHDLIEAALADERGADLEDIQATISHVWFSSIVNWVLHDRPAGTVGKDLEIAARLIL